MALILNSIVHIIDKLLTFKSKQCIFLQYTHKIKTQKKQTKKQHIFILKFIFYASFQIKNPVFMMLTFAGSANTLIISGVGAFSFKFLMEQYNLDIDLTGYLIGM
jgi:hypothetical protein